MNDFLERIGLRETFQLEFKVKLMDFVRAVYANIDEPGWDPFEAFSGGDCEYKGKVNDQGFELQRKRKFFNSYTNLAKLKGSFTSQNEKVLVDVEVTCVSWFLVPLFLVGVPIYAIIMFSVFSSNSSAPGFIVPFILLHASGMLGIPYFILRKSVKNAKRDLEKELYFMLKEPPQSY